MMEARERGAPAPVAYSTRARPPRRLTLVGALLLAAVASAGESPTGWWEVQTPHVTLRSDLNAEDARRAALTVERDRGALLAAAWAGAKLLQPEHIEVVVFEKRREFDRYFPLSVAGLFTFRQYPPTAFLSGPPEKWEEHFTLRDGVGFVTNLDETSSVVKHELTHYLAAFIYRRQPKWFSEGLAQYLETLRFSEDGKTATLGEINVPAMRYYRSYRGKPSAEAVLGWGGKNGAKGESDMAGLYGVSWLLVHWLNNVHPQEFARFQALLVKGIDPDKAWKAVFPNLSTRELDTSLEQYASNGDYHVFVLPIPPGEELVSVQPMTSANVHATRAAAALAGAATRLKGGAQLSDALKEIEAALDDDPGNVRALRLKIQRVQPSERLALGRRASAAHPEDGLAWLTLAEALSTTPETWEERAKAYQKATALLPDNPTAFNNLAWMYVQAGRAQEALPLATAAARMAPWDSAVLDTLAAALSGVGRCSEAVSAQTRALDVLPEDASVANRADYAARLEEIQRTCAAQRSASPGPVPEPLF
jgi:Flp pilus assembly protein TadD